MTRRVVSAAALAAGVAAFGAVQATAQDSVPIVAVTGCLVERSANAWALTSATDPVPSTANAPPAGQQPSGPTSGRNEFRLIGVSEFDLPSHKGHTVLVKALFIKATPVSRLNVTSLTMVAPTCPAPAPKPESPA